MATSGAPFVVDCESLVTAGETLTGELVFERLLQKLVRACAQIAKAERAVLILKEDGLVIRATATETGDAILERQSLAQSTTVPVPIVERVFDSHELLLLADGSVLAVPIVKNDEVLGVVYLENKLTGSAFTPERVEMLRLLSGLMANAIENSRIFRRRARPTGALRRLTRASTKFDYDRIVSKVGTFAVAVLEELLRRIGVALEQKEIVGKLEDAVSRWEATINATADGILATDTRGNISAVNERYLSLWRVPAGAAECGHHLKMLESVFDDLEDPEGILERIQWTYAHKEEESSEVVRFKDGRIFECVSTPQYVGETITGRVWSIRDVTEREHLLQRTLFLADATRLLASLDIEQALESVAHLAVPYLGDRCAIDLFADGDQRRLIAVSRDTGAAIEIHPAIHNGNSVIYEDESASYLAVPMLMKRRLVGAITFSAPRHRKYTPADLDLAEELGRRAALATDNARLYRRAREALRARDEFLSIAAHEIRGPINSIHLAVQSIRHGKVPSDALPRLFDLVERQDRRLSQFVEELLDLGRIQAGRLHLEYRDVDLSEVVREVVARLNAEIGRSGSSLSIQEHDRVVGRWDKSRLDQVVSNLISNAIKFGHGKPIEVTIGSRGGRARLTVKDHGPGIDRVAQKRIFEPFERGVSVRHYGGLGLGLHIVKTIVNALGGSVSVESEPGFGSTFAVELPQTRTEEERDAHPADR